jgi:hypothetical protein
MLDSGHALFGYEYSVTNGLLAEVWGSVPTPAPEPSSLAILIVGIIGASALRRAK